MERKKEHPIVYLTADAVISSLGFSTGECWENMMQYRFGVSKVKQPMLYTHPFLAAQIDNAEFQKLIDKNKLSDFTRIEQLLVLTIGQTLKNSKTDASDSGCGLIISSTKGNIGLLAAENETDNRLYLTNLADKIAAHFGFSSQPIVVCNACISGVSAMIAAKRLIENGVYEHMVVAGGDELSMFVVSGFHAFKSVSSEICMPYDAARNGLSLGEACGSLLLTSDKRKVSETKPVCLLGGSVSNDANHISGPSRTGEELAMAVTNAIHQANLLPEDISFVNTHGTATIYNDEMESKALHLSGLTDAPMQSLKPFLGHTLGASGIIETIFCKKQIEENIVLGIPNFEINGVSLPLNISAKHRKVDLADYCVKTASGFGGCNAAIVIGTKQNKQQNKQQTVSEKVFTTQIASHCQINISGVQLNDERVVERATTDKFATFIRKTCKALNLDYRRFYKMDNLSKLGLITTEFLLRSIDKFAEIQPENKGIVAANRSASLNTDINYRRNIDAVGDCETSPAIFVYTLPNVMLGEICIRWKIKGENTFFVQNEPDFDFLMDYARIAMTEQNLQYCIVGWCDLLGEDFNAEFWLIENIERKFKLTT